MSGTGLKIPVGCLWFSDIQTKCIIPLLFCFNENTKLLSNTTAAESSGKCYNAGV